MVFALPLGRRPLANQDEARFALLAREAVESHHWLLPRVRGVIYLNKPPLYFWTVALLAKPFGVVNEATAPLASVLAALAALLAVIALGRRLWGASVGLAAALVLATAPFFYFMSHQVFSDMMMTAWLAWALYFLLTARLAPAPLPRLVGFYLCVAGALATKGPAALMALGAALAVVLVEDGWRRGLRWLRLPVGIGILALASLPWLLPYLLQTERSYVGGVVVGHYGDWYFRAKSGSRLEALLENLVRFLPVDALPAGRPLVVVARSRSAPPAARGVDRGHRGRGQPLRPSSGPATFCRCCRRCRCWSRSCWRTRRSSRPGGAGGCSWRRSPGPRWWRWGPRWSCSRCLPAAVPSCRRPAGRAG